jgi:hypothetical protein
VLKTHQIGIRLVVCFGLKILGDEADIGQRFLLIWLDVAVALGVMPAFAPSAESVLALVGNLLMILEINQ